MRYRKLAGCLKESKNTVVFTGAGMSTEPGLPDFRSAQGLWRGIDPRRIASIDAFHSNKEDCVLVRGSIGECLTAVEEILRETA